MRRLWLVLLLTVVGIGSSQAAALDPSKIDRTIAKEPTYRLKPQYCLLVCGPDAKTRVWVVLDGDILYVDRNGDGDLTEEGKRVVGKNNYSSGSLTADGVPRHLVFDDIELTGADGRAEHRLSALADLENQRRWTISVWMGGFDKRIRWQRPDVDVALAARPQDARIVHFAGPLTFALSDLEDRKVEQLVRGDKPNSLYFEIGTPVRGDGWRTFARTWANVTADALPTAEVELPGKGPGAGPVKVRPEIHRCECGGGFWVTFQIPPEVGEGKARITLSYPNWREGEVAPAAVELPIGEPKDKDTK
jgi:hypothetical protein